MANTSGRKRKAGGGRPRIDIESYFARIKGYLEVGCSIHEACIQANVPYRTVMDYVANNEELSQRIVALQDLLIYKARNNRSKKINEGDYQASKDYLERKKKNEFSLRTESTGADGKELNNSITIEQIEKIANNILKNKK